MCRKCRQSRWSLPIITDEQMEAFAAGVESALSIRCLCSKHPSCSVDQRISIHKSGRLLGGSANYWTKPIECQIVVSQDSFFSVTLLKHFCQSVSFYYGEDNINIVQYKYCFYLCENDDV